jgi:hypothetical protein
MDKFEQIYQSIIMKIPETYEEFLKLNQNEFNQIALSNLSLNDASRIMKFINLMAEDLKKKNIILDNNK